MRSLTARFRLAAALLAVLSIFARPAPVHALIFGSIGRVFVFGEAYANANGGTPQRFVVNQTVGPAVSNMESDPMSAISYDPTDTNSASSFGTVGFNWSLDADTGISGLLSSLGVAHAMMNGGAMAFVSVPYGDSAGYKASLSASTTSTLSPLANEATLVRYDVPQNPDLPTTETTIFDIQNAPPGGTTRTGTLAPGTYWWTAWFREDAQDGDNANLGTGAYFHFVNRNTWPRVTRWPVGTLVAMSAPSGPQGLAAAFVPTLTLTAGGTGGNPLQRQWLFNGAPLGDGGGVSGSHGDTLIISPFSPAWNGAYAYVLSNAGGSDTSGVAVCEADHVSSAPLIGRQPYDGVLSSVFNVFAVDAGSSGPLTYQWLRGATDVTDGDQASGARISGSQGPALVISAGTAAETGDYQCIVTDAFGSVTTRTAHLRLTTSGVGSGAGGAPLRLSAGPNPARAASSLAFVMPAAGPAQLEILDVAGRRVATLESGRLPAGLHVSTWDLRDAAGRRVSPGVFLARLAAGGVRDVRPIVVLR